MPKTSLTVAERLEAGLHYEPNTGCWLWDGAITSGGYGTISIKRKTKTAHRVSYELHHGPIPAGMFVCHRCDTRGCVNPDHLFLGTAADNNADCRAKFRHAAGERIGTSKLTEDDVREIRSMRSSGLLQRQVAERFGIVQSQVSAIYRGEVWGHLQ